MSGALLDERVIAVNPSLIREFGPVAAIVLQQVHYLADSKLAEELDGEYWIPITRSDLADETGLTAAQVRKAITDLEARAVIVSIQPEHYQRRKWYRIDYQNEALVPVRPLVTSDQSNRADAQFPTVRGDKSLLQEDGEEQTGADAPVPSSRKSSAKDVSEINRAAKKILDAYTEWVRKETGHSPATKPMALRGLIADALKDDFTVTEVKRGLRLATERHRPIVRAVLWQFMLDDGPAAKPAHARGVNAGHADPDDLARELAERTMAADRARREAAKGTAP